MGLTMASRRALSCIACASPRGSLRFPNALLRMTISEPCFFSTSFRRQVEAKEGEAVDFRALFAKPSWSVEELLPPKTPSLDAPSISSKQLHHLLRLSALPPPKDAEEEKKMLETLSAQLHFVGKIQQVDVTNVEPLRTVRDETRAAEQEQTITMDSLKDAFAQEEIVGKHHRRIQRKTHKVDAKDVESWDVLGSAERRAGRFFVVDSKRSEE